MSRRCHDHYHNENSYFLIILITDWFSMYGRPVVVANCDESIREILITRSSDYAGRPISFRAQYLLDFKDDIAFTRYVHKWTPTAMAPSTTDHKLLGISRREIHVLSVNNPGINISQ